MTIKNLLVGFLVAFVCSFLTVAHAEEVDSYFVWDIKNQDDYQPYSLLFKSIDNDVDDAVIGIRDKIYTSTICGNYFDAVIWCEWTDIQQKIAFGENYLDENLIELTAKLYLMINELDKAEQKINLFSEKAKDNLTKIRALNLKSDLCNRRGNYQEALKITETVAKLLRSTSDENLSLINQSRMARAYCGLDETKKSLELAEKIFPSMQYTFGKAGIETLALMSTLAEDYRKVQRHEDSGKILTNKLQIVKERYGQNDPVIVAKAALELADFYFSSKDTKRGEENLNVVLASATKCADDDNNFASLQLYTTLKETAIKSLDENNPIVLKADLGIARMNNVVGDIPQSIEICTKNLAAFKNVFNEQGNETLALMKILSDDYLLLGKYSDAKSFVDERLTVCKKNFGDHDARTAESAIDSANLCYRTGKFATADKLLADVENQCRDILASNSQLQNELLSVQKNGAVMKGAYTDFQRLNEKTASQTTDFAQIADNLLKTMYVNEISASGSFDNSAGIALMVVNLGKMIAREYNPKNLQLLNAVAEAYIESGKLSTAENFAQQIFDLSREHFGENNFYEWMALNTLAKIRRAEENFTDALAADEQALQIAETVCDKNSLERLQSLDAIASDHAATGNVSEAIKIREQALSDYKEIVAGDESNTLRMMTNLAKNYISVQRYTEALQLCDEILAKQKDPIYVDEHISFNKDILDLFRIKAQAQRLSGDTSGAMSNYVQLIQAYEIKRNFLKNNLQISGNKSKWFSNVIDVYEDAAITAQTFGDMNFAFYCAEFCKGRNLIDRYDDLLVSKNYLLRYYERETLDKYQQFMTACRNIIESAVAKNNDALRFNAEIVYHNLNIDEEEYKRSLRERYSNNMVPKDPQKRAEVEQKLSPWEESLKNFDVKKNRQTIPNGACLVEFLKVSDDSLLVMFLRNDSEIQAANISVDKKFFDKCRLYHEFNAYTDIKAMHADGKYLWQNDGEYIITAGRTKPAPSAVAINDDAKLNALRQELSAELSQNLIPTIETYANGSSHWIISPDSELNLVPFETLIYHDKILIESVDVSYVPSLAVLNLMHKRAIKNAYLGQSKDLFAMGDAVYEDNDLENPNDSVLPDFLANLLDKIKVFFAISDDDLSVSRGSQLEFFNKLRSSSDEVPDITHLHWNNLPGTARELEKVSTLFDGDGKDIFRKEQVTEKNLQELNGSGELSKYKYILFATHGLFVPDMPEISSIVLSQKFNDEATDGYVTVGEWMGYDLRSNLVYLSACESGLGGYQAGEGIVGIPYALTVAGNKDTVMSLWKVDDEATAEFTSAVFEKLRKGKSEVVALNDTKREFLKNNNPKYRSSSVWAAFLLYGI